MSYEKTTWETGDIVTAEKLNNIENGIENAGGGGVFVVGFQEGGAALNKTWKEIHDAIASGKPAFVFGVDDENYTIDVVSAVYSVNVLLPPSSNYYIIVGSNDVYVTDNETGYPTYDNSGEA